MKALLQVVRNVVALALQDVGALAAGLVRRGADGVPTGWRLFGYGPFRLTQEGQEYGGEFLPEHATEILAQAERKGTPIPLDAHHALAAVANALGIDETELAAKIPGQRLTLAYGHLRGLPDGLWLEEVEWTDVGRRLMAGGHFRYFSPVLRGLSDGRLRITSVALTNNPALQGLDAIAAEDDGDGGCRGAFSLADLQSRAACPPGQKGEHRVMLKRLLALVGRLTGQDCAALEDASALPETAATALESLATELPGLRAARALGAKVREVLALGAEADEATVEGTLRGLLAKGQAHDALKTRVDALELEAETAKRAKVIERGLAEGKLTKAMIDGDWCKGQNAVALEAFLAVAPVVCQPGKTVDAGALPKGADAVALTAEEEAMAKAMGMTRETMLEAKKLQAKQQ